MRERQQERLHEMRIEQEFQRRQKIEKDLLKQKSALTIRERRQRELDKIQMLDYRRHIEEMRKKREASEEAQRQHSKERFIALQK